MATKTYKAKVKLPNGNQQQVNVQADNLANARSMLEGQFGKGSIVIGPSEVMK